VAHKLPDIARPAAKGHDDGFVLVFWAISLTALAAFFLFAITLGNLVQSAVDIQGAADSLALAGAQSSTQQETMWTWSQQQPPYPPFTTTTLLDTSAPSYEAKTILSTYGIGIGRNWSGAAALCPAPPIGSYVTTATDGRAIVCMAATNNGCTVAGTDCTVWVDILEPQPSLTGNNTVVRTSMAYLSPRHQAMLCDIACPVP
jgi:hypothetical protein